MTRIYKNRWFHRFARDQRISLGDLIAAVDQANRGLVDADLGGGLIKQRIARDGAGKSAGYRVLIFFRQGARAVFVFGFAKKDKATLDAIELQTFKKAAKYMLAFTQAEIEAEVHAGRLIEVTDDAEDL